MSYRTLPALAPLVGLSASSLRRLCHSGVIPATKQGRDSLVSLGVDEIKALLAARPSVSEKMKGNQNWRGTAK